MGEIAEGLIDGTFDSITGEYLGEGPGYPRTMEGESKPRSNRTKTKHRVRGFINQFYKDKKINGLVANAHIMAYSLSTDRAHLNMNKQYKLVDREWKEFKDYVKTLHGQENGE